MADVPFAMEVHAFKGADLTEPVEHTRTRGCREKVKVRHKFEETAHHGWIRSSRPSAELNNAWFRPRAHGVVAEMR